MKQVYLHFKEIELGYLTEEAGGYNWVPSVEGMKEFYAKYEAATDLFFLTKTEPKVYKQIPHHYDEFVEGSYRADLAKDAEIAEGDTPFERLYKMGTLDYFGDDFYIKV